MKELPISENMERNNIVLSIDEIIRNLNFIINTETNRDKDVVIIPDCNILICTNFLGNTYSCRNYLDIPLEELENTKKSLEFGIGILDCPNVYIVYNQIEEIRKFSLLLSDKMNYYNEKEKKSIKKYKIAEKMQDRKRLYNEIGMLCNYLIKKEVKNLYKIEDSKSYKIIFDVVDIMTEKLKLKPFKPATLLPKIYDKRAKDIKTDEQIVATALYISLVGGKSCSILSRDIDVHNILKTCAIFLKSEYSKNDSFRALLELNPVSFYNPSRSIPFVEMKPWFSSANSSDLFYESSLKRLGLLS